MKVNGYAVFTFRFHKEGNRWVAYCDELGTATFGRSIGEAERKLHEAVLLHLNTLEDVGEQERFFSEHNIKFYATKPGRHTTINVPIDESVFIHPHVQRIPESVSA